MMMIFILKSSIIHHYLTKFQYILLHISPFNHLQSLVIHSYNLLRHTLQSCDQDNTFSVVLWSIATLLCHSSTRRNYISSYTEYYNLSWAYENTFSRKYKTSTKVQASYKTTNNKNAFVTLLETEGKQ